MKLRNLRFLVLFTIVAAILVAPTLAQEDTFVYWGGLIFSDEANDAFVERIEEWGELRGVDVEVIMINQNETVQRVSAAIEAGTMPDALDLGRGFALLLSQDDLLIPVTETYEEIGEMHDGWLDVIDQLVKADAFGDEIYGVPFAASGINVLYRRVDVLEPAGYTEAPETWDELAEMAADSQNPPEHYGMGFALSDVGDANGVLNLMLQGWGGRIADDDGLNCMLDSPETREFLTWISEKFDDGLFSPGATTADGGWDNTAYQSGNALFIANPGSVYLNMRENDPELLEATRFSGLPGGPVTRILPVDTFLRSIPASTSEEKQELALDLFAFLAEDDFMAEYMSAAIYGPAMQSQVDFPIFTESPVHVGLLDAALNGTPSAFPEIDNLALAEYNTNFVTPGMVQRVVVDGLSVDDAAMEAQETCQAIYDRNNE